MKTKFFVLILALGLSAAAGAETLNIVPNENVCMVTDMYFSKKQTPVSVGSETYYGCCATCEKTLAGDVKARTSVDPVTGKTVDKARAVVAARADGSVLYFESRKTFERYSGVAPDSGSGDHSTHHHH